MTSLPGHVGLRILSDKSLSFYKNAVKFSQHHCDQYKSSLFQTQILTTPTVIVSSNAGTAQLLKEHADKCTLGYKSFVGDIYSDNILFTDGNSHEYLHECLGKALTAISSDVITTTIVHAVKRHVDEFNSEQKVPLYDFYKRLCTEICLALFLDLNLETSGDLANEISQLSTTHWHGIISIPIAIHVPGMSSSGKSKALRAKTQLLTIIDNLLQRTAGNDKRKGFLDTMKQTAFSHSSHIASHILLFTSALAPKAMASLLTSFFIATQHQQCQSDIRSDGEVYAHVWKEVERLWPPFVGGRRNVKQAFTLDGFNIPVNYAVIYITQLAHRDPHVFLEPDMFRPARWKYENANDTDKLFTFGGGSKCCIGEKLVRQLLQDVSSEFVSRYSWTCGETHADSCDETRADSCDGRSTHHCDIEYKWLPVCRPKNPINIRFTELPQV